MYNGKYPDPSRLPPGSHTHHAHPLCRSIRTGITFAATISAANVLVTTSYRDAYAACLRFVPRYKAVLCTKLGRIMEKNGSGVYLPSRFVLCRAKIGGRGTCCLTQDRPIMSDSYSRLKPSSLQSSIKLVEGVYVCGVSASCAVCCDQSTVLNVFVRSALSLHGGADVPNHE